ncbi:MAG TPA: putative ABC exporter domain-containing protein, partial [Candidatus Baltobacteraceae bacterium]
MSADLAALAYLEYRQIVNRIRETARQPSRALLYVIVFAYFIFLAYLRVRRPHGSILPSVPEPYASALFLAYLTLLGVMMYGAASGIVGAFSSAADARFLCGSLLRERLVIFWLQLRRSGAAIGRMMFTILLYAMMFYHSGTFGGIAFAMAGGTVIVTATTIPMLKLRLLIGTRTAQSVAGAVAAAGILPMAILLASLTASGVPPDTAHSLERIGAGYAFNALFNGNPLALLALYTCAAALVALSYASGSGLYADLYASSLRVIAFRDRQKRGGASFSMQHKYEQPAAPAAHPIFSGFAGPWTIVWKEWIAFARSSSMRRLFVFWAIVSAAAGAIFGHVLHSSKTPLDDAVAFGSVAANVLVIFVAIGSAVGLASDIAKPLWWMGRDPLWMRLLAWTAGTSWRF